jgi:hypothetical protein
LGFSLRLLCVLGVFLETLSVLPLCSPCLCGDEGGVNHGDTKDTEEAQRRLNLKVSLRYLLGEKQAGRLCGAIWPVISLHRGDAESAENTQRFSD